MQNDCPEEMGGGRGGLNTANGGAEGGLNTTKSG